jgi:hypothetical protein
MTSPTLALSNSCWAISDGVDWNRMGIGEHQVLFSL